MAGVFNHPEIDDWLTHCDEVLAACPGPTTSEGSTSTLSGTGSKHPGKTGRSPKKSKHRTAKGAA
jgi:hypothetical protein